MPDGILILFPGSCPRGGTWGCLGAKIEFRPAVCPLCYFLLNHCTKFKQFWCVSYSHEWGVQLHFFTPPPGASGKGQKVNYHLISITKSISKSLYQALCVFSQKKDTKHIRRNFHYVAWVMPQGAGGTQVAKMYLFQYGHVAYQIDKNHKQNRMQVKILS